MQVQQWGVVGAHRVVDQVLLNGVSLSGTSQEVDCIIQTISVDAHLPTIINVNQTSLLSKNKPSCSINKCNDCENWQIVNSLLSYSLGNHTVLRSRECILEGSQLHWTDRVFFDGEVYLTLDHTDSWAAHVPQALALKVLWDQELQRTRAQRIRLQEGCIKLMRELRLSEEHLGILYILSAFLKTNLVAVIKL